MHIHRVVWFSGAMYLMRRLFTLFLIGSAVICGSMFLAAESQNSSLERRDSFELSSVKPATPIRVPDDLRTCIGNPIVDPGRFVVSNVTVYTLITMAYGMGPCMFVRKWDRIVGGPEWVRTDQFAVEGKIPEGSEHYDSQQLRNGDAPQLQQMIKSLMQDRFKLELHEERREIPVYSLTVATGGAKFKPSQDGTCVDVSGNGLPIAGRPTCGTRVLLARGRYLIVETTRLTLTDFAEVLGLSLDRPVVDSTGLSGLFDIHVEFARDAATPNALPPGGVLILGPGPVMNNHPDAPQQPAASVFRAIQEQLGLTLEPSKSPVDVLVIDSVKKSSEN